MKIKQAMVCEHNGAYQGPVGLLVQEAGLGVQLAKGGYPLKKNKVLLHQILLNRFPWWLPYVMSGWLVG